VFCPSAPPRHCPMGSVIGSAVCRFLFVLSLAQACLSFFCLPVVLFFVCRVSISVLDLVCSVAFLFPSRFLFYQCYCSGYVTVPSGCGLDLLLFRRRLCHYSVGFPVYVIVSVSLLSVVF
jgi:hypothetical protein